MTDSLPPCMGGWCERRDQCARYHQAAPMWVQPSERLCQSGTRDAFKAISLQPAKQITETTDCHAL